VKIKIELELDDAEDSEVIELLRDLIDILETIKQGNRNQD